MLEVEKVKVTYLADRSRHDTDLLIAFRDEERIALNSAVERERIRLLTTPWHERAWGRAGIVAGMGGGLFSLGLQIYSVVHH